MKCRRCGASVPADSLYCNYCGNKIIRSADRDPKKTRPREENFDEVSTAKASQKEAAVAKPQQLLPILAIIAAGLVIAILAVVIFDVMKKNQRTIVTPGTETIEEGSGNASSESPSESESKPEESEPETAYVPAEGEEFDYQRITYRVENGTLTLVRCNSLEAILELPASVYGLRLYAIGDDAFRDCLHIQYLDIPEGVVKIGARAFYGCYVMREIVMPSTLKESEFGEEALAYTGPYTIICIPNTFPYWLAVNNGLNWKEGTSISIVHHDD